LDKRLHIKPGEISPGLKPLLALLGIQTSFDVFDNHNQRQKITKNGGILNRKQTQDHQKQRHLCIKNSVTRG